MLTALKTLAIILVHLHLNRKNKCHPHFTQREEIRLREMEWLVLVSGRAGTHKQVMSHLKFITLRLYARQCSRQYKWSPTSGSFLLLKKQKIVLPCPLEVRHVCPYWPDMANKMRTTGICVILGQKYLNLAGKLTSSPYFLVTTFNMWKQVLIQRCHKIKQPGMMSQHMEDICSGEPPGSIGDFALAIAFTVVRQEN